MLLVFFSIETIFLPQSSPAHRADEVRTAIDCAGVLVGVFRVTLQENSPQPGSPAFENGAK